MFDSLNNGIKQALKNLKGQGKITELNVSTTIKSIRRALVNADVNFKIAKEVTEKIKQEAIGKKVILSVSPGQLMTKIVSDELTELMGSEKADINIDGNPSVILIAGLQGSGKTTFTGKLAHRLKEKGYSIMVAACDVYRPAAIEQLKTLAESVEVPVYTEEGNKDPVEISQNALQHAKEQGAKVLIVDTAGRLAVDEKMMTEVSTMKDRLQPSETLFVVDSMTGQDAVNTAKAFDEKLNYDGIVLTKLDGDTRGGAAITIRHVVNKPIKFISTGEKMRDLDVFYPDRMASRILGMGDVISVVERAQQVYDEEEARRLSKKIRKNKFDFDDFVLQLKQLKKMGSLKDIVGMIPGLGDKVKDINLDDNAFQPFEVMISSMTKQERSNPDILNHSRRLRISKGSGIKVDKVNSMIKQFEDMRKIMRKASRGGMKNILNNMNIK